MRQATRNPDYPFPAAVGVFCTKRDELLGNIPNKAGGFEAIIGGLLDNGCKLQATVSTLGAHGVFIAGVVYGSLPLDFKEAQQSVEWNPTIQT
jgi:hypothetical protein